MYNPDYKIHLVRITSPRFVRAERGFTLIEMMMVVAILGIIAAVALPTYREFIMKGRRSDGIASLHRAAQWMEKSATIRGAYPTQSRDFDAAGLNVSEDRRYMIRLRNATPTSFTLEATPTFADDRCIALRLNHQGVKDASGSGGTDYCWRR